MKRNLLYLYCVLSVFNRCVRPKRKAVCHTGIERMERGKRWLCVGWTNMYLLFGKWYRTTWVRDKHQNKESCLSLSTTYPCNAIGLLSKKQYAPIAAIRFIFQMPSIRKVENIIILNKNEIDRKEKWKIRRTVYKKGCKNIYRFRYNIYEIPHKLLYTEYSNTFQIKVTSGKFR